MILQYKLMPILSKGILQNKQPILLDLDSNVELSFLITKDLNDSYYLKLTDSLKQAHRAEIIGGRAKIPYLLLRPQILALQVEQLRNNKIVKVFKCGALRLSRLNDIEQAVLEIKPDYSDTVDTLAELANKHENLLERVAVLESQSVESFKTAILEQLTDIIERHNLLAEEVDKLRTETSL